MIGERGSHPTLGDVTWTDPDKRTRWTLTGHANTMRDNYPPAR